MVNTGPLRAVLRIAGCVILVTVCARLHGAEGRTVTLDDFETGLKWNTFGDGSPRPTGGVRLITDNPHGGKQCGSFFYDVTGNSGYVSSDLNIAFPPQESNAVRFVFDEPSKGCRATEIELYDE